MEKQIPQIYSVAVSLMGHDKGRLYLVVKVLDADFVLVSDGKVRKVDNPKKKRFKHLKVIKNNALAISETLNNDKIAKILKQIQLGG